MAETVALSVRIDPELHRRVRLKAVGEGVAVEALLRGWLGAYADGVLMADGARVAPAVEMVDGAGRVVGRIVDAPVAIGEITKAVEGLKDRPLKPHAADPKDKAAQEHGKREKKPRTGLCPHRVPVGVFCKRCEEGT